MRVPRPTKTKGRALNRRCVIQSITIHGVSKQAFPSWLSRYVVHNGQGTSRADSEELEAQLAHVKKTANGDTYDRATVTDQRIEIMQDWADYLDKIAKDSKMIPWRITLRTGHYPVSLRAA